MTQWNVGDRVRNKPELAHLYDGTHWAEKLSRPRLGTVTEVPLYARETGEGTLLVHWDSLTGDNTDKALWERWMHSTNIERAA